MRFKGFNRSLSARLLWSAAITLAVFMLLTSISLQQAYKDSLLASEQESLRSQVFFILGEMTLTDEGLLFPDQLLSPDFNQPDSGLYGFVHTQKNNRQEMVWQSQSALSLKVQQKSQWMSVLPVNKQVGQAYFSDELLENNMVYSFPVIWEELGREQAFQVTLFKDKSTFLAALTRYKKTLWQWLAIATIALLLVLLWLLRWGLRPVYALAEEVKKVEEGKIEKLSGEYPKELEGLSDNLNTLLNHERNQRLRYRHTLDDLAHSLKTPLAVMQGELTNTHQDKALLTEQLQRMDDIVQHQLARAVRQQLSTSIDRVDVAPALQRVLGAMQKIYSNKSVAVECVCDEDAQFKGDERDLMEVLGNVLDNAFKHANQLIRIQVGNADRLELLIEDDGDGVPDEKLQLLRQRGQRLDTQQVGQGIGLAVVDDIVSSYGGELELAKSELGGLAVRLTF